MSPCNFMIKVNVYIADTIGMPFDEVEITDICKQAMPRYAEGRFTVRHRIHDIAARHAGAVVSHFEVTVDALSLAHVHPYGHLIVVREYAKHPATQAISEMIASLLVRTCAHRADVFTATVGRRVVFNAVRPIIDKILGERDVNNTRSLKARGNRVFTNERGARFYTQYVEDHLIPKEMSNDDSNPQVA